MEDDEEAGPRILRIDAVERDTLDGIDRDQCVPLITVLFRDLEEDRHAGWHRDRARPEHELERRKFGILALGTREPLRNRTPIAFGVGEQLRGLLAHHRLSKYEGGAGKADESEKKSYGKPEPEVDLAKHAPNYREARCFSNCRCIQTFLQGAFPAGSVQSGGTR